MITIVGLGNPGDAYAQTRHNVGSRLVRAFVEETRLPQPVPSSQYAGEVSEGTVDGVDVRVLLPGTFMNKSGSSVKKAVTKEEAVNLVVIYDDLDLKFGEVKISFGRGSGGHNGIKSVIDALGTKDFTRIRIGISPVGIFGSMRKPKGSDKVSRFVVGRFSPREERKLPELQETVNEALHMIIREGRQITMNKFN